MTFTDYDLKVVIRSLLLLIITLVLQLLQLIISLCKITGIFYNSEILFFLHYFLKYWLQRYLTIWITWQNVSLEYWIRPGLLEGLIIYACPYPNYENLRFKLYLREEKDIWVYEIARVFTGPTASWNKTDIELLLVGSWSSTYINKLVFLLAGSKSPWLFLWGLHDGSGVYKIPKFSLSERRSHSFAF